METFFVNKDTCNPCFFPGHMINFCKQLPRVCRVFSLCLAEKMETTVDPAQSSLHKGPLLCNGYFFHSGGRSLLFQSLYNGHLSTTATATQTRPSCQKNFFTTMFKGFQLVIISVSFCDTDLFWLASVH